MSQLKKRDSLWWGSRILVGYGVALTLIMGLMMVMYSSNPILPEEEPLFGFTFAEVQLTNPYLADYIWWVQMAFSLPGFTYPALFTISLAWYGVRNRQKWAWFSILVPNLVFWGLFYVGCKSMHPTTYIDHWTIFSSFFVVLLVGLILSARQIFSPTNLKKGE